MDKKLLVGSGAAALLSLGTLIGGVTTGLIGAQSLSQQARQAQTAPTQTSNAEQEGPEAADGPDAPVSLPAGSVSQDAAKQAAITYVQQTAPYNAQGLSATQVKADDENGAAVYKVDFAGANNQAVEVTVSTTQGTVIKAEAGAERPGVDADGPAGHADAAGAPR